MSGALVQIALAGFGLTALYLAIGASARGRRWAPIVGLIGQPFWIIATWQAEQAGMLALSLAYTAVYAHGVWVQRGRA